MVGAVGGEIAVVDCISLLVTTLWFSCFDCWLLRLICVSLGCLGWLV